MDMFQTLTRLLTDRQNGAAPGIRVYPNSCVTIGDRGLALVRDGHRKMLCEIAACPDALSPELDGEVTSTSALALKRCRLSHDNAETLRRHLPWTAPVSLRDRRTTLGCGDRLGRATPGHIQAVSDFDVSPVLAQQSIRELNLTGRTYEDVVDDVTFLVLQEGYTHGYGADGDHLKTLKDIDMAVDAGMAMITLDLSEVMIAPAERWSDSEVNAAFARLPESTQQRVLAAYADQSFDVDGATVSVSGLEARRCAGMYLAAMDFAREVHELLRQRRGDAFDLEISIDETEAPTLPAHHLFIIRELLHRGIVVSSLAPRFIGEFQKAIDYVGDLSEFERQFAVHCGIARAHGGYKLSIHSGSDKFSVYPVIGKYTRRRVHVKTAGTSWLEAVRTIAVSAPALYRDMHRQALDSFEEALKLYHVTPDFRNIPDIADLDDSSLPALMDQDDARQLLHVVYGWIVRDPELAPRFFAVLDEQESIYCKLLEKLFTKHLEKLGIPKR